MNATQQVEELARRSAHGIDVSLLWDRAIGDLTVSVHDARTGDYFELPAHPGNALDVFNHPFAYADARP